MRVPQVSERIKEAPAQALRGVFAGIGQLLLVTDRLRNKTPLGAKPAGRRDEAAAPAAVPAEPTAAAEPVTAEPAPAAAAEPVPAAPAAAEQAPAEPAASEPVVARASRTRPVAVKPATPRPTSARRAPAKPAVTKPTAAERPRPPKPQRTRDLDKTGNVRLLGGEEAGARDEAGARPGAAPANGAAPASGPGDAGPPLPGYDQMSVASLRARLRKLDAAQVRQLAEYERAHAARAEVVGMFERRIAKLQAEADVRAEAEARTEVAAEAAAEVEAEAEGED